MRGFSDRCNDNDVYARIILPLQNHYTCSVTPGVTATRWGLGPRLIWCETQFCGEEPDHRYHNVSRSTSTQSPNAGPWSAIFTYLGTISCWGMITIYFCPPPPQAFFVQTTGCQLFPHKLMIAQFKHPLHWKLDQRFLKIQLEPVGITHYATKNHVLSLMVTLPCWSGNCSGWCCLTSEKSTLSWCQHYNGYMGWGLHNLMSEYWQPIVRIMLDASLSGRKIL